MNRFESCAVHCHLIGYVELLLLIPAVDIEGDSIILVILLADLMTVTLISVIIINHFSSAWYQVRD